MDLYRKKYRSMEKTAGTKIPEDPKQWSSEVLKQLVSQHPYVPKDEVKIAFTKIEPESKETTGKIIIKKKCAIPFTIRPNDKTNSLELDSLDVLFDGEKFTHLNEGSLRKALDEGAVAEIHDEKSYGSSPPSNRYIGDETGDVTPLEYSGFPSAFSGSRMSTADCGLLSKVVRGDRDLENLKRMLHTYSGVNSITETIGLNDSLEMLSTGMEEGVNEPQLAHVMKRPDGSFAVEFENGDSRICSARDLKNALGPNYDHVMRQVMQRGWCMVRDFATLRSVEQPVVDSSPAPVEKSGRYRLITKDGDPVMGYVFSQMIDFDGSKIKKQKAVLDDKKSCEAKALMGTQVTVSNENFPIGVIDTGTKGFFVDESFLPSATPSFTVKKIISYPDQPEIIIGNKEGLQEKCAFVMTGGINRPQKIRSGHYDAELLPEEAYYIPNHMSFVEVDGKCELTDRHRIKTASSGQPEAVLHKNANRYTIHGKTHDGAIDEQFMTEEEMRMKLAWNKADDYVIERACAMKNGQKQKLYGLETPEVTKEASSESVSIDPAKYQQIKKVAMEAMEGIDEAAQTEEPVEDPHVMDSILSLQFINDETLEEIIESQDVLEQAEDKLAKLLLASRQGEESIHERGVQKALKGLGQARQSLKTLEIELEARDG